MTVLKYAKVRLQASLELERKQRATSSRNETNTKFKNKNNPSICMRGAQGACIEHSLAHLGIAPNGTHGKQALEPRLKSTCRSVCVFS